MLFSMVKRLVPLGAHWWMVAVTLALFGLVAALVDLKPVVDENFFFSTKDPQFRQSKKIEEHFPSQPEVILAVSSRDISSPHYLDRIQRLTQQIKAIDAVNAVKSLTDGPKNFQDALASPFWSRLLIARDRKSSNVIVFIEGKHTEKPITRLERIMHKFDEKDAAGFAIFVLSDFPPTQRFGLVVLADCIVDILANLFVLPLLGGAQWKKK